LRPACERRAPDRREQFFQWCAFRHEASQRDRGGGQRTVEDRSHRWREATEPYGDVEAIEVV
jgi:hypothetical protein